MAVPEGTECGAGLRRDRGVRIGARQRRPVVLGVGALLAVTPLLPLLPLGTLGYAAQTSGAGAAQDSVFYGGEQNVRQASGQVKGFKGKTVDVILRPNPAALVYTIDQTKIYHGEIVLKGVDVQRQEDVYGVPSAAGGLIRYFLGR